MLENDKRRVDAPLSSQMDDQSQQEENDEVVNQLESLELNKLNQIIAALKRIETGNFGICNQCHDPISPARLDAFPSATTCIACTKEMSEIIL